jgi:hypothetical protein
MSSIAITTDALELMVQQNSLVKELIEAAQILRDDLSDLQLATIKPVLLTTKQAAEYLGVSVSFLEQGRETGQIGGGLPPPGHLVLGMGEKSKIMYELKELDRWIAEDLVRRHYPDQRPARCKRSA